MIQQKIQRGVVRLAQFSSCTPHHRIVTFGLLMGLFYLPDWLKVAVDTCLHGSSNILFNLGFLYLGLDHLWKHRKSVNRMVVSDEERLTGYLIIFGSAALFPVCFSSVSLRALLWAVILIGIAYSSWGIRFFKIYAVQSILILVSLYPDWTYALREVWKMITPAHYLENLMAWAGSLALQAIGQPAIAKEFIIELPAGAVQIGFVCNGFEMAVTMAGASLLMGLWLKQSRLNTIAMVVVGVMLALIFNIPRIMLLTIASVYWGKDSFDFWHGTWGGQIFSTILFTVYYYLVMWIMNQQTVKE
ncbi:cyanoexosortase C [Phormidesmis priestleyi ULC007]|uniref:Cyanoexosortase C n=1 Tax=Phormidesmis priestleyi ULC007 TaxID=1920490 RepID=A0A2T1DNG5_9CYAN|nr:cyanoexosortase C [Phormidesmis priestleyi]PSB22009.1 cyanoexosortase C [Phormidesmis priestleyi ULC007]PZO55023.1 MAG: cyanoexosortase C [Phormidesmis priestleyi]